MQENDELRESIRYMREKEEETDRLHAEQKRISGKYWSAVDENRLATIGALVQDSKARYCVGVHAYVH
jgi:hypothetical protein